MPAALCGSLLAFAVAEPSTRTSPPPPARARHSASGAVLILLLQCHATSCPELFVRRGSSARFSLGPAEFVSSPRSKLRIGANIYLSSRVEEIGLFCFLSSSFFLLLVGAVEEGRVLLHNDVLGRDY